MKKGAAKYRAFLSPGKEPYFWERLLFSDLRSQNDSHLFEIKKWS